MDVDRLQKLAQGRISAVPNLASSSYSALPPAPYPGRVGSVRNAKGLALAIAGSTPS